MAPGAKGRDDRVARERARVYQARLDYQRGRQRRRRRDNLVAGIAGSALLLAIIGGQVLYYTAGPGVPEPEPTPTPTQTTPAPDLPLPDPDATTDPEPTPTTTP
ncbi:dioxygenase [Microbacterium sp. zg.Y625]|uniref:dioxygenase n=1 Tax=Microbacterium jiangjiandongii TaxID=3049071 RepID=UPI00214AC276|nr:MULTISPECIES: dioxygenase [unclassified Microbacterium]MCR2792671.1 dioxygenase [Microbacterium sp. zg.Y625]MCR2814641.1 dioxygenase [Microbacterium sp. zg.Y843]WIM26654.1 dioxygenase [Microbacterium sp. zg-Y625]